MYAIVIQLLVSLKRNRTYHEVMEKRDENVIGGQKDRAIFQIREALERGLDEIPTFPKFHLLFHRENLENERVHLAVVSRLFRNIDLLQFYVLDYAGNHRLSFVLKKRNRSFFSFLSSAFCELTWNVEQRVDERARLHFRLVVHAKLTSYPWKITDETYHRRIHLLERLYFQLIGTLFYNLFHAFLRRNYRGGSNAVRTLPNVEPSG